MTVNRPWLKETHQATFSLGTSRRLTIPSSDNLPYLSRTKTNIALDTHTKIDSFFCWLSSTTAFTSITYYGWYLCAERFKWNFSISIIDDDRSSRKSPTFLQCVTSKWAFISIVFAFVCFDDPLSIENVASFEWPPNAMRATASDCVWWRLDLCAINAGGFSTMCHTCCKCPKCQVSNRLFQCLQWKITGFLAQAKPIGPYRSGTSATLNCIVICLVFEMSIFSCLSIGFYGCFELWT